MPLNIKEKITWHIVARAVRPLVVALLGGLTALLLDAGLLDGQLAAELQRLLSGS
jgi:hypothetical protein